MVVKPLPWTTPYNGGYLLQNEDKQKKLIKMKIAKVIYISCNVSTLARDLNYLQANNYEVIEVTPYDMFPQTSHIESVTKLRLLER